MIRSLVLGTVLLASALVLPSVAHADQDGHRGGGGDWRGHGERGRGDHGRGGWGWRAPRVIVQQGFGPPPVYYAPPPVYYAPPPVFYQQPPVVYQQNPVYVAPSISLGVNIPLR